MSMLDRRTLLSAAMAAPLLPGVRLHAAPAGSPRLLVVFMRGAYDSASVLVPTAPLYAESRPTLAIGRGGPKGAVPLDADWGLNPVLAPSLLPFWQKGELAFVPYAGTLDTSRSHFGVQDTLEYGLPMTTSRIGAGGFLNRLVGEVGGAQPIAFTQTLPLIFRGRASVPNLAPSAKLAAGGGDAKRNDQLSRMYAADKVLGAAVASDIATRREVSRALAIEMATAGRDAVGASSFENVARRIGTVMRGRTNLGFVDVGGWDTHADQRGQLDFKLIQLGKGLAAFAAELGPAEWARTTVVVMSEFGRTLRENGARGTDHGNGTVYWVMGGNVRGGRIAGRQVKLVRSALHDDRDLPVLNEARGVFAGLFQRLYGLDQSRLARVFPGAKPSDIGLV